MKSGLALVVAPDVPRRRGGAKLVSDIYPAESGSGRLPRLREKKTKA
jgi:hypothetical protein